MKSDSVLYWSTLSLYERCPQNFLWSKGWEGMDVGGGIGKKRPKPVVKSEHHAFMGTVIQGVIEKFYNDELYRFLKPEQLKPRLLELSDLIFIEQLDHHYIDWRFAGSKKELEDVIKNGVLGFLSTLKAHKFLGPYARAEVELPAYIDQYNPIGGRADMIIKRDDTGITILDGKNSKRDKSGKTDNDPCQLKWYALCYYLAYRVVPDRLAFVYYRYPYGKPILDSDGNETSEKETGVSWVEFTKDDLKELAKRAVEAKKGMHFLKFSPKPSSKACRYCDYETVCEARQGLKECSVRKEKESSLDSLLGNSTGIEDFGF